MSDLVEGIPPPGPHFPRGTNKVTCTLIVAGHQPLQCTFNVIVDCPRADRTVKITPATANPNLPGAPREIVVEFEPDSNVVLEVADNITGPWIEVPNVPSRHVIKVAQEKGKFFRLREKQPVP